MLIVPYFLFLMLLSSSFAGRRGDLILGLDHPKDNPFIDFHGHHVATFQSQFGTDEDKEGIVSGCGKGDVRQDQFWVGLGNANELRKRLERIT